jgi:hypothetical protein
LRTPLAFGFHGDWPREERGSLTKDEGKLQLAGLSCSATLQSTLAIWTSGEQTVTAAADGRSGHLKKAKVFARKSGGYVRVKILLEGKLRKNRVYCVQSVCSKFMLLNFMGTDELFQEKLHEKKPYINFQ